ncbi:MAG: hypothetical protein JNM84_24325 [Planctomycetes bacterium]|nr:hypothetical protein [Planctomycetota bacterium]
MPLALAALALCSALSPVPSFAQDPPTAETREIRVLPLGHVDANEMESLLAGLVSAMPMRFVADVRTNALVMQGEPALLARWSALVGQLDRPAEPGRQESEGSRTRQLFPPVSADLEIGGATSVDQRPTLLAVLEGYAARSGQELVIEEPTRARAAGVRVGGTEKRVLAAAALQGYVERLLVAHDLALLPLGGEDPHLCAVVSTGNGAARSTRERAVVLAFADLEILTRHPAVIFSAILPLEHADAQQVSAGLRQTQTDNALQSVVAVGESLLLTGTGAWLQSLVATARLADHRAGERARSAEVHHEVFALRAARAEELGPILREVLSSASRARSGAHPGQPPQGAVPNAAIASSIQLDLPRNALLVTCARRDLESIRALIEALDRE